MYTESKLADKKIQKDIEKINKILVKRFDPISIIKLFSNIFPI